MATDVTQRESSNIKRYASAFKFLYMHCYKIIIIKIKLQKLKFVTYLIIFVWLTFAFF